MCQVYLKNCKEANLATAKCGEEQKVMRSRDGDGDGDGDGVGVGWENC